MSSTATKVYLNQAGAICTLGSDINSISQKLFSPAIESPLTLSTQFSSGAALALGVVNNTLKPISPSFDKKFYSRNNQLLQAALSQIQPAIEALKQHYGAHRIGVIIGSSTSGIKEGEQAVIDLNQHGEFPEHYHYSQQEIGAPSAFVANFLKITGPAWTISTACTSSAKALASAQRLIKLGVCDAVIAGGCDSLCKLTVEGFSALSAVSKDTCKPFSKNRSGINIGEAAALFVLSKETGPVSLCGYGETSDAHHISAPHPTGDGASAAMAAALTAAKLRAKDIGYINLHGTATEKNDAMEATAVNRVFGPNTPCSSTKPLTGHTLGAAGALEALFCWLSLQRDEQLLPPHHWDGEADPELAELTALGQTKSTASMRYAMSNSFAFGGNNISLIFERTQ